MLIIVETRMVIHAKGYFLAFHYVRFVINTKQNGNKDYNYQHYSKICVRLNIPSINNSPCMLDTTNMSRTSWNIIQKSIYVYQSYHDIDLTKCFSNNKISSNTPNEFVVILFLLEKVKFSINISPSLELIYFLRVT